MMRRQKPGRDNKRKLKCHYKSKALQGEGSNLSSLLTATFRANSFCSDVMFRWITKAPLGGRENDSKRSLEKKKKKNTKNKKKNILSSVDVEKRSLQPWRGQ